ncbi:MAG: hypothetical protein QHH18_05690 [Candidatus Bathyarchaeota archaeon]|nr:hypothetical protein [Candidatus Bathyarchaeota archaeon A05DMB-5]MDH7558081.1 hypothetical protein [Candidatus Bathyarchaeota archaeon]
MKINYIGIIAGILAFVSIALPWWTMAQSATGMSGDASIYLYQAKATYTSGGTTMTIDLTNPPAPATALNIWYSWTALALVIIGGVLLIVGSVTALGKKLLLGGGVLALIAIIVFAVGLQNELSNPLLGTGPTVGLFSSGNYLGIDYSTYLSFGFWIALVAAIIAFVAFMKHPTETAAPPS